MIGTLGHRVPIAEYELDDYEVRTVGDVRIVANSVSGQATEPTATVVGRIGGHDTPRAAASGQGGCVLAVIFPRTVGVADSET